jgi:VWFA-related protein
MRTTARKARALFLAIAALAALVDRTAADDGPSTSLRPGSAALSVRITSPLGRTGEPGAVRIVAQIRSAPGAVLEPVQFFVDGTLLSTVANPPYAADWVDANPFEANEITVTVTDSLGNAARDAVQLKPLEVTDISQVSRVLLDTSVRDKAGRVVRALGRDDFQVREDGIPQPLDLVNEEDAPATFALLVDSSQSMARRIDFVREAAGRLAGFMRASDRMLVVPFSRTLQPITGPTDDRATVAEAIAQITPNGGTAILDCLIQFGGHLENVPGRKAIVLITDGYDEHSEKRYEDALEAVKKAQATIYVVGIGGVAGISLKGERFLRQLAEETGGRAFLPSRESELAAVHDVLAADVQNRYLLSYSPTNQEPDGTWRTITVATADPRYKARTRSGYFAPRPAPVRPSLEFTITGSDRQFLDVEADDLEVVEDGVPQAIDTFHEAVTPVSIVLALDASGSMKKWAETTRSAAAHFVDALRPDDQLAVLLFADRAELAHDLGTERDKSHDAIGRYRAEGGTSLYDALGESLDRLKHNGGRRAIVVVTDGRDENNPGTGPGSIRTLDQVLDSANEVDAVIFGIGIGGNVDRRVLETLAAASGGEANFTTDITQLDAEYRRIVENLRRRWVISYSSTDGSRDGAWRTVEIRTKDPNATVHSRGGYYAPGK